MTPEVQAKISVWRQKALDGSITLDEMKEAIVVLRQGRIGAAIASDVSRRKKAKSVIPSADDLMSELEGI